MDTEALLRELVRGFAVEAEELCQRITRALLQAEAAEAGSEALRAGHDALARAVHNLKGSAATIGLPDIAALVHQLEDRLGPLQRAAAPVPAPLVDAALKVLDAVNESLRARVAMVDGAPLPTLEALLGGEPVAAVVEVGPSGDASPTEDGWRIGAEQVGLILAQVEQLRELRLRLEERHRELLRVAVALARVPGTADARATLLLTDRSLQADVAEAAEVVEALEGGAKAICTTPLEGALAPLHRTVRDLGRQLGKEAKLSAVGADLALDRRAVEVLKGPLAQLVRNALDHGLETPEVRERAGKHRVGALVVRVEQVGNLVRVEVSDDGAGLDLERIRSVAVQRGLLSASAASTTAPAEVRDLIFRPGFSTREQVSGTSGRGVGLDLVRAELARLQGHVEVEDTPGQGTRFTLSFPAEIGNTPLLLVRVAEHVVGLPMHAVRAVVAARGEALRLGHEGAQVVHEGALLDVIDLGGRLGVRGQLPPFEGQPLVLLETPGRAFALAVDELLGERELVVRPLPDELRGLDAYQGLAVLASGEPAGVLRAGWLAGRPGEGAGLPTGRGAVLVVDDSLTTRAIHRSVLESGGFVVRTASSAANAQAQLARSTPVAVVCDISLGEGLDGIALIAALRARPETHALPVVLVSADDSEAARRRGVEAGADGYLSKRECAGGRLLAEVSQAIARRSGVGR